MTFRDTFLVFPTAFLVAVGLPSWAMADEDPETTYTETVNVTINETYDIKFETDIKVKKDVEFVGSVAIDGTIDVDEAAFATIDNKQIVAGNSLSGDATNDSLISEGSVSFVEGNVGVLIISGFSNVADNAAAIAELGASSGVAAAEASVTVFQDASNNKTSGGNSDNSAVIGEESILGISGNVGVAVIAGAYNIGKNALAIAHTESDIGLAEATVASVQSATTGGFESSGGTNTARIGATSVQGITGNTGIVVLSGTQNLGANSLSIAAAE